jgi:hypothetical protein
MKYMYVKSCRVYRVKYFFENTEEVCSELNLKQGLYVTNANQITFSLQLLVWTSIPWNVLSNFSVKHAHEPTLLLHYMFILCTLGKEYMRRHVYIFLAYETL